MHNSIIATTGMDQENHLAQDNSYANQNWVDMNSYNNSQNSMSDYSSFSYMPPVTHGLPSESIRMPPPPQPPPQPIQPAHPHHPQLPMLMVPSNATWPSMLTNPSSYSAPPISMPPMAPTQRKPIPPIKSTPSQPRRTLTDEQRRQMCQYHADNPTVRQTEIGALFGVERSTVSKVLRQKEKYLFPEDRSNPRDKRPKSKFPDIERALSSWAKKAQQSGHDLSDSEILEKARHFSHGVGGNQESHIKALSSSWLEKFKQKNGLGGARLMRRASETNIPDRASMSQTPTSATSPTAHPSPLSGSRSDEDSPADKALNYGSYKHANSQSTTSLSSAFTDTAASSFSGSALSPTGPFTFSPDPNTGGFLSSDQARQMAGGAGSNFQRPRSQTFPTLDLEYMNQPSSSEPLTPKFQPSATAPSSALDSPMHELGAPPFGLDTNVASPPSLRRTSSNGSMAARSTTTPITGSAVTGSSPSSPTQEDARRAADTLLTFMQTVVPTGMVDHNEYLTVLRLTEKLKLHQHQAAKSAGATQGLGGLTRIPEGDGEMPPVSLGMKVEPMITG